MGSPSAPRASDPTGGGGPAIVPEGTEPAIVEARHRCTDMRNAQRLYEAFGAQMLSAAGEFFVWAGTHWEGGTRLALRNGCHLSALIEAELKPLRERAAMLQGTEMKDASLIAEWEMLDVLIPALESWGAKSEQGSTINAALAILKQLLDVPMTTFDVDPWLLNVSNGTVDLRTGELRAHDPRDRITRVIRTAYTPGAECPRFESFLGQVFTDEATRDYLQRYFGYSITGSNREQTMLVHWGKGSNGKNTLHRAIRHVIGAYGQVGPPGLLTSDKEGQYIHELASLYGARWVSVDENDDGARLKEAAFKQMTGDDNVRGRHLYKSFFEYLPTYKLHLLTNFKPRIVNGGTGVWRRLLLLPYKVQFLGDAVDKGLSGALEAEAPGILAWLVEGARRYAVEGLKLCPEIRIASAEYRNEEDMVAQFIAEKLVIEEAAKLPTATLYSVYTAWARENGAYPLSKKRLTIELTERPHGITTKRIGDKNEAHYMGCRLL
jgi:putative DNA primase/helicase